MLFMMPIKGNGMESYMILKVENIEKSRDNFAVLKNVSFELKPGVYGLLGANGAGKTTLFHIICGILNPDSGNVLFDNKDTKKSREAFLSELGFLPQDFAYYPDFTGLNFMLYIAALKGFNKKAAKTKSIELLNIVGLEKEKNVKIKKYSGGMKQRLGIAQTMLNDPKILILDEPTVGLDPKERVKFRNLISSFSADKIVILSTHIVSDVEYIAGEILILKEGVLVDRGSVSELIAKIQDYVWECSIETNKIAHYLKEYVVSNQKQEQHKTILRIVSKDQPTPTAQQVEATLEDLYLYYFRKEENL